MKKSEWLTVIKDHEQEIKKAFQEAERLSCLGHVNMSQYDYCYSVTINQEGNVRIFQRPLNVIDSDVREGHEYLISNYPIMKDFPVTGEALEFMTEEEQEEFKTWCRQYSKTPIWLNLNDMDHGLFKRCLLRKIKTWLDSRDLEEKADSDFNRTLGILAFDIERERENLKYVAGERVEMIPELNELSDVITDNIKDHYEFIAESPLDDLIKWAEGVKNSTEQGQECY
jgi:hypothetical protein